MTTYERSSIGIVRRGIQPHRDRLTQCDNTLAHALAERHPPPGLVHHSDRGVQYASKEYVTLLRTHHMIPSMSRPANPYDNASFESFMKTLKREEIYANTYRDLDHLHMNIETFIDQYYDRARLHSALGTAHRKSLSTRWR